MNLDTKFQHSKIESEKYNNWVKEGLFNANTASNKTPFTIVLPPPNVTGKLHLGHAWDGTLQDILIRYKKMNNFETMWIAGMDHAGIATQAKVDGRLSGMGISRFDIGREKFLEYAWDWKEEYAKVIRQQWGKMGFALDYSKEKFTLDEDVNNSVMKTFVKLYEKGLIYQGYRITNWDPKAKTALSDIEVIHKEINGNFYHLKYILEDGNDYLEVATTRPETLFGDMAVAVNPNDERYKKYIGKKVFIPSTNILIPIIADDYAKEDFGSGAVKITPAHDPNDYEVGQRHKLEMPIVMNLDGTMNSKAFKYEGMDRYECRKKLVEDLKKQKLLIKIEEHIHNVGHSERTGVVVETVLSKQWYVKMEDLAKKAIEFQKTNDKIDFYPERFEKTFLQWMEQIQDWCISRQLWWGHQIPAWYHNETGEVYVSTTAPIDSENYTRDEDVLDTWFSSALWPMVTTIWREDNEEMDKFFPTNVLVTGYDIIFFWVSRMIFQSLEFTNEKPFNDVLIHGLIRGEDGRKMSKSLGNGIDPMDVIESHGADALRLFLIGNSTPGQDLRYSQEKLDASWNFLNKVWNISRFVLMNTEKINFNQDIQINLLDTADKAIINKFNISLQQININMEKYEFGEASKRLINFIWEDFAAWYVEITKIHFNEESKISDSKKLLIKKMLVSILKLLHPFAPFITDEIYRQITKENVFNSSWPKIIDIEGIQEADENFQVIKEIIIAIRNFREQNEIAPKVPIKIVINTKLNIIEDLIIVNKLANVEKIYYEEQKGEKVSFVFRETNMHIINEDLIDIEKQKKKLEEQKQKTLNEISRSKNMLSNEKFIGNASEQKIKNEIEKAKSYVSLYEETKELLKCNFEEEELIKLKEIIDKYEF